jgi:hypothetical protein
VFLVGFHRMIVVLAFLTGSNQAYQPHHSAL